MSVITGVGLLTPWGDRPEDIARATSRPSQGQEHPAGPPPAPPERPEGGGGESPMTDVRGLDLRARLARHTLPPEVRRRLDRLARRLPWSTQATLDVALAALADARWWGAPPADEVGVIAAGHNLRPNYGWENWQVFQREPDYIDPLFAVHVLDTDHAAVVSELLGARGPIGTVGASATSAHAALRAAQSELLDGAAAVVVLAPLFDWTPHGTPPWPVVHAAVAVVLEPEHLARGRGAPIRGRLGPIELGFSEDPTGWLRWRRPPHLPLVVQRAPGVPMIDDAWLDLSPLGDPGCSAALLGLAAALTGPRALQAVLGSDGLVSAAVLESP